ncbi:MAG TPA: 2,3-bisphosphoglycerate-independent phosphoglycerate mutase [Candidatus Limnocylindria bacterium]|nr:2,3-bisphosphoglycerate-independent phosphoglycerate mutase [Candidatus Limnocylindria bacterium]
MSRAPVVLCVLDGWGIAPDGPGNAVTRADTPRLDDLLARYPRARLEASGTEVGLPAGVMGNSEVGHLTMGAGYAEPQAFETMNQEIASGAFFERPVLLEAMAAARAPGRTLHLLGLLSTGGVHADMTHLRALAALAEREGVLRVALHAFLDGRDMPPRSAIELLPDVPVPIATIHGRFYAMDRDQRWERTHRAWRAIVDAEGGRVARAEDAIRACYQEEDCRDELLEPHVVGDGAPVADGDVIVFFNFRPDRARQLTRAFMDPAFDAFPRARVPRGIVFVTMTDYKVDLPDVRVAYAAQPVTPIAELIASAGLRQFHVAETEKYAHVTYFFNGGREDPFPGEDRVLVPSPKAPTYDLAPEMSAAGVAEACVKAIGSGRYAFVIVNFANPDMVGHTGVIEAALEAMRATDEAVGRVVDACLGAGGHLLLTADHGNAEEMLFPDGGMNTQHSTNPVPVVLVGPDVRGLRLRDGGLRDVAPTLLALLGIDPPARMTGRDLVVR